MNLIYYHKNCDDGFGGAWAAWLKFGDDAQYTAIGHDDPLLAANTISANDTIILIDISLPNIALQDISVKAKSVTILDHHKTAKEDFQNLQLNNISAVFNMEKSGAMLAWEHFHPNTPAPLLVRHIQDSDLWIFRLPRTKQIMAGLRSYRRDFSTWNSLETEQLADEGDPILRSIDQQVMNLVARAEIITIAGHDIPVVNSALHGSEIGHALLDHYPKADFAAIFYVSKSRVHWSLRSRRDFDISTIAKSFGGGGHPTAAGFTTNETFLIEVTNKP
jgi:nanoRNase/pAp phosphatase (c-di-AMP/oligoRNAs hydrolase)